MAIGDVLWDQHSIPPRMSGFDGTPGEKWARSARSSRVRSGPSASFSTTSTYPGSGLFDLAIDSKLRGCDLVKMRISDIVCDRKIRTQATVVQQKTGRPVQFELMDDTRAGLLKWLELRGGSLEDFVFPRRTDHSTHISSRQYAHLADEWVTGIGLPSEDYGTHSLRRTKASIIYKATGNLRAVQILLGHTKIESTVRYLAVDMKDALSLAEGTEI